MKTYKELTEYSKNNPPKKGDKVLLSPDLMGYGNFSNSEPLKHNHGEIIRIVPANERKDQYQLSGKYTLVEIELPNKEVIKAYENDLKILF